MKLMPILLDADSIWSPVLVTKCLEYHEKCLKYVFQPYFFLGGGGGVVGGRL